jgi:hypothetical protein
MVILLYWHFCRIVTDIFRHQQSTESQSVKTDPAVTSVEGRKWEHSGNIFHIVLPSAGSSSSSLEFPNSLWAQSRINSSQFRSSRIAFRFVYLLTFHVFCLGLSFSFQITDCFLCPVCLHALFTCYNKQDVTFSPSLLFQVSVATRQGPHSSCWLANVVPADEMSPCDFLSQSWTILNYVLAVFKFFAVVLYVLIEMSWQD